MIKLTQHVIFKNKIVPIVRLLKEHPLDSNARIAISTINHYVGQPAIDTEESLNIYDRDYFTLALTKGLHNSNTASDLKDIYSVDLSLIKHDGMSEYFILGYDKRIHHVHTSDVLNIMTTLLERRNKL